MRKLRQHLDRNQDSVPSMSNSSMCSLSMEPFFFLVELNISGFNFLISKQINKGGWLLHIRLLRIRSCHLLLSKFENSNLSVHFYRLDNYIMKTFIQLGPSLASLLVVSTDDQIVVNELSIKWNWAVSFYHYFHMWIRKTASGEYLKDSKAKSYLIICLCFAKSRINWNMWFLSCRFLCF